jgi:hypothetical protein
VIEEAKEYDRDETDVLHETIDGHCWVIYTAYNFQVLQHSDNDGYAVEEWGSDCATRDGVLNTAMLAFGALWADVSDYMETAREEIEAEAGAE